MKLNDQQRELVSNNIKLIHKVIHDKVHNPHQAGIFSYDDLFQIGCIGLCKAAATDKGGVFSTYPDEVTCISLAKGKEPQICNLSDGMPENSIIQASIDLYKQEVTEVL